jgi:ATPase subunit of ABC transporter with duplicated ATPase domains
MGNSAISQKIRKAYQERRNDHLQTRVRFNQTETRRILLVGPSKSGKTQLMNRLVGIPYSDKYVETETAVISHKLFSTTKSDQERLNPIAFKVFDVPGTFIKHKRAADYYFLNV